jgi:hypothetical protein
MDIKFLIHTFYVQDICEGNSVDCQLYWPQGYTGAEHLKWLKTLVLNILMMPKIREYISVILLFCVGKEKIRGAILVFP